MRRWIVLSGAAMVIGLSATAAAQNGASPFSLAVSDDDKTLWVGLQPSDRVAEIATGRGG